jgi:hypothetical protein
MFRLECSPLLFVPRKVAVRIIERELGWDFSIDPQTTTAWPAAAIQYLSLNVLGQRSDSFGSQPATVP